MLEEFARCYLAKTGQTFVIKCRQIRYVSVVDHAAVVLNLQTRLFTQVPRTHHQLGYSSSHLCAQQGKVL
jgi:hypothetical protein